MNHRARYHQLLALLWFALLLWQAVWHGLSDTGLGLLGLLLSAPLLVFLPGVYRGHSRSILWAALLTLPLMMLAAMELWANAPARPYAGVQLLLSVLFVVGVARR